MKTRFPVIPVLAVLILIACGSPRKLRGPFEVWERTIITMSDSVMYVFVKSEFMDSIEADPSAYSILMAHIPVIFEPQLSGYDFDLGIAGHVHGGLVVLPFIGGLYTMEEGFFPKFTAGRYTLENQQTLIISAGLGDSKAFPPRINNMPELVVIDINRY